MELRSNLAVKAAVGLVIVTVAASLTSAVLVAQGIPHAFQSAQRIQIGNQIAQVVASDLNLDGKKDFVTVAYDYPAVGEDHLVVLLNNGHGGFHQGQQILINRTSAICIADFNGDGIPDAVYGDPTHNGYLVVAFGKGDGTFQPGTSFRGPLSYAAGNSIVAADFNGDGKIDIAERSIEHDSVMVLLNQGNGTFGPVRSYGVGSLPFALATGDFNHDGISDLVVMDTDVGGDVRVLYGDASGVLRPGPITKFVSPAAIAIGDVDKDGNLDIAVASGANIFVPDSGTVSMMFGQTDGSFKTKVTMKRLAPVSALRFFDPKHDGVLDLGIGFSQFARFQAAGYFDSSHLAVYPGKGDGTFKNPRNYNIDSSPVDVLATDINGDGRIDLVTANDLSGTISVLNGDGEGNFDGAPLTLAQHAQGIVSADFNHDGKPDIAVVDTPICNAPCHGTVSVFLGPGHDWFRPPTRYEIGMHGAAIATGDVNGDGIPDLVVTNDTPGDDYDLSVLLGKGDGTFQPAHNYNIGTLSAEVFLADVNLDHKLDLVTLGGVALGSGHGTFGTLQPLVASTTTTVSEMAVGDFNGDGFPDIAIAGHVPGSAVFTDQLDVLLGNGTGKFKSVQTHDFGMEVTGMAIGKLNADTVPDLVLTYGGLNLDGMGEIGVLPGRGDGTFIVADDHPAGDITYTFATPGWSVAIADLNNDGINDIAVSAGSPIPFFTRNDFLVFPGKGDGTMGVPSTYTALSGELSRIAIADFTGDGRKDVVVTNDLGITRLVNVGKALAAAPPQKP